MRNNLSGRRVACHPFRKRSACPKILNVFTSTIGRTMDLPVNDVQRAFFDIERGFSDGFA